MTEKEFNRAILAELAKVANDYFNELSTKLKRLVSLSGKPLDKLVNELSENNVTGDTWNHLKLLTLYNNF